MNIKQSTLAAAVTAALALGVSTQASAYVYGAAGLTIDSLTVKVTPFASAGGFSFTFNQSNLVSHSAGVGAFSFANCGGTPGAAPGANSCTAGVGNVGLDAAAVNDPGPGPRTNNAMTGGEFTFFGPAAFAGDYANADSQIVQAALVNGATSTKTHNIAESLLNTGTSAAGTSQIQSRTSFSISFAVVGGPADLELDFNADPDLFAAIIGEASLAGAQANINASFTLTQNSGGAGSANWTPQGNGIGINDCTIGGGVTCDEDADTQDLNINVGTGTNNDSDGSSWDPNALNLTAFGITVKGLTAGNWTLVLNEQKSNQLERTVPEPASMALLGIGLLGMGMTARRNKKQA